VDQRILRWFGAFAKDCTGLVQSELNINLSPTLPIDPILWVNWLASQERFVHDLMR